MQRCPYLQEMKERLEVQGADPQQLLIAAAKAMEKDVLEVHQDPAVGTVVKLNAGGYGSHTSPTHHPLIGRVEPPPLSPNLPKNAKTSLFIILSFIYAKLLIVVCIAYVVSEVITHSLPLIYYEGFFTYLYGVSILFLLYVFCFLLQESACCAGGPAALERERKKREAADKKRREKERSKAAKEKEKQDKEKAKKEKKDNAANQKKKDGKDAGKGKDGKGQETFAPAPPPQPDAPGAAPTKGGAYYPQDAVEMETGGALVERPLGRKRKTSQNNSSHGSFFLRVGAIAFGLGTMIYNGLEFGTFFETPMNSPCYNVLRGVNPVLQMVFTFMQMYFIFMNSRLNIHRFKVIARFGLMHIVATNLCVWIRTLMLESLKEVTTYLNLDEQRKQALVTTHATPLFYGNGTGIRGLGLSLGTSGNTGSNVGTHHTSHGNTGTIGAGIPTGAGGIISGFNSDQVETFNFNPVRSANMIASTVASAGSYAVRVAKTTTTTLASTAATTLRTLPTTLSTTTTTTTTTTLPPSTTTTPFFTTLASTAATTLATTTTNSTSQNFLRDIRSSILPDSAKMPYPFDHDAGIGAMSGSDDAGSTLPIAQALQALKLNISGQRTLESDSCGRMPIMGTIVQDAAPYLYPFIIEYSLIGAAVVYVMWRHIGYNPRYVAEEDLEQRLEAMLSQRAVALARAQQGRVDCVGASKGLFFGLLLLVGSLICLILFFVLIRHSELGILAIYLADVSHSVVMALSIIAIVIGFCSNNCCFDSFRYLSCERQDQDQDHKQFEMEERDEEHDGSDSELECLAHPEPSHFDIVQGLKFKRDEQSDLNDILLRVSAFGLFVYAVFSVIAGSLLATTKEPNMLVMVTGVLSVLQVVLQLLFIADVSRRRVHLPEHDRSKPGRQIVTFLLICNVAMWVIYTFEMQKVAANPVQLDFYGFLAWAMVQRITLPLCIFHRFHSAVTLAEIWKTSYKARLE